jgi:GNAT superfamily N-acetyltransferase
VKPGFDERNVSERIHEIDRYGDEWFVAAEGGQAVGWIVVRWRGKRTHPECPSMEDIYVREQSRGRGIGSALIRFVEDEAGRRGHESSGLAVNPTKNERARALYERLGYEATGGNLYLDDVYDGDEDWVIDLEKHL